MPAAGDVSSHTHALRTTTNDSRTVLVRELVDIIHGRPAADGDGIALNDGVAAVLLVFCEREGALMEGKRIKVMHPDGEGSRRIGPAEEVVAAGLDIQTDIILAGWTVSL